jgi:hypothetical protein
LDVPKQAVVATVRVMVGVKVERECRDLRDDDGRSAGLAGVADQGAVQPCADGGLLEPVWNIRTS